MDRGASAFLSGLRTGTAGWVLLLIPALCLAAPAEGAVTAYGVVYDRIGEAPVAGARITPAQDATAATTSSTGGTFTSPDLPAGPVIFLDVEAAGFVPARFLVDPGMDDVEGLLLPMRRTEHVTAETAALGVAFTLPALAGRLRTPYLFPAVGATVQVRPAGSVTRYLDPAPGTSTSRPRPSASEAAS